MAPQANDSSQNSVKDSLTPQRPSRSVENTDYVKFARRVLRGLARRVADGDVEALPEMVELHTELNSMIHHSVHALRDTYDYSWAEIADRVGITRQAAQQRWGKKATCHEKGLYGRL